MSGHLRIFRSRPAATHSAAGRFTLSPGTGGGASAAIWPRLAPPSNRWSSSRPAAPRDTTCWAGCCFRRDRPLKPFPSFETALRLKPDFAAAHINLANALAQEWSAGGSRVRGPRPPLRLAPNDAEAHRTLGRIASFRSDLATAATRTEKGRGTATASGPTCATNWVRCWRRVHNRTRPRNNSPRPCACSRISLQAALHLGVVRWQQKQMDEALSLLQQRGSKFSAKRPGPLLSGTRAGRHGAAGTRPSRKCRTAVKLQPDFVEAQTQLGKMLQRVGDAHGAVAAFRQRCATASQRSRCAQQSGPGADPGG